ncbi:MAG: adenylate/guanylate cyclase domain-containing protein [Oceanococcus sp.]
MNLTERFIDIGEWPTSRKTMLWTLILVIAHALILGLIVGMIKLGGFRNVIDTSRFLVFAALWLASLVAILVISWYCAKKGWEGRWTAYLLAFVYSGFVVANLYNMGTMTSHLWALLVIMVFIICVFWDMRVGLFSLACVSVGLSVVSVAQLTGHLPYAPLVLDRSIDSQNQVFIVLHAIFQHLTSILFCAGVIGLVLSASRLQNQRLATAHAVIRRYIPAQVADSILENASEVAGPYERRKLTIFFSDIVGFTEISEELEPEDLSRVLNDYFAGMTDIANHFGGTIDELTGDAILIFFGAPAATDDADHAQRAVAMALQMQAKMIQLNDSWASAGIPVELQIRTGVNTGVVTVGTFGSDQRQKYAALGKHVNLAARIQSRCEPGKVLISYSTWLLVKQHFACNPVGEESFKGITKPVKLYELSEQSGRDGAGDAEQIVAADI